MGVSAGRLTMSNPYWISAQHNAAPYLARYFVIRMSLLPYSSWEAPTITAALELRCCGGVDRSGHFCLLSREECRDDGQGLALQHVLRDHAPLL